METTDKICVIGAGPAGCYLALMLAKRGYNVVVLEKRGELTKSLKHEGRSFNLVLSIRGVTALARLGLKTHEETGLEIKGGDFHEPNGNTKVHLVTHPDEIDWAIDRNAFNLRLLEEVRKNLSIEVHFDMRVVDVQVSKGIVNYVNKDNQFCSQQFKVVFGADGAHSVLKKSYLSYLGVKYQQHYSNTEYLELFVPPDANGQLQFTNNRMHMWPRREAELRGFANFDNSCSLILFMPKNGRPGLDQLQNDEDMCKFLRTLYPDVCEKIPNLEEQIANRKYGYLMEAEIYPWTVGNCCLIGDAAHAMLPFSGLGLNTTLEDLVRLDEFLDKYNDDFQKAFASMQKIQYPNAKRAALMTRQVGEALKNPESALRRRILGDYLKENYSDLYTATFHLITHSLVSFTKIAKLDPIEEKLMEEIEQAIPNIFELAQKNERRQDVEDILKKYQHHFQDAIANPIDYALLEEEEFNRTVFDTQQMFMEKEIFAAKNPQPQGPPHGPPHGGPPGGHPPHLGGPPHGGPPHGGPPFGGPPGSHPPHHGPPGGHPPHHGPPHGGPPHEGHPPHHGPPQ